ncbi:unnamed protein product [Phyllotreta striolata]|uniref:C2H2-type domain-containing protein n=1 Tax=Phyllotreta striolata TaxID=444603 RepID=A0A9N9XMH8_PHYSR|nr:unnamed protein product [Phyllotreta striolata]
MHEQTCLQCNKVISGPSNRLIKDSCGHEKCRICLLEDENDCKQCQNKRTLEETIVSNNSDRNGDLNSDIISSNHTGVIQINGNVPVPSTSNLNGDIKHNNTIKPIESTPIRSVENFANDVDKPQSVRRPYSSITIPKHVTKVSDPPSYHCTICNKTFITKTHVKYHLYCAGGSKPFKCDVCGKGFILRSQLDVHSYKHKSVKPYACQICRKSFNERSKLTRHSAVHTSVKSHVCSICGNAYRSKESLRIHSIIHRSEKPYGCKLCDAKFSNQSNLNKHGTVHKKERTHMCDLCGKRYKQKWALTVHKSSHIKGKSFECNVCLKKFTYSKDLHRHNQIHIETEQYECSICSTVFRRRDNLRRHMKNTHPGKKGRIIKTAPASSVPPRSSVDRSIVDKTLTQIDFDRPVDNPNAIKVITSAAPAFPSPSNGGRGAADAEPVSLPSAVKSDCRNDAGDGDGCSGNVAPTSNVVNGPFKLAFKTPAFKSNYNINGDFGNLSPVAQLQNGYNMAESVEICQKIMSTDTSLPTRNVIVKAAPPATGDNFRKQTLDVNANASSRPLLYETSFQNNKHAMIKNIKFKVPIEYTNQFSKGGSNGGDRPASVIVNMSNLESGESGNLYWRRRTSQNLTMRN